MRAEIRGIVEGMRLAWERGIRKLSIQTDSRAAVALLTAEDDRLHRHIYLEANYAADYMANMGQSLDLGVHVSDNPDNSLLYWLRYDLIGVCEPRAIFNTT
ncbi:Putative ribonuclease H protein At1g65750 [Linum perenne]